MSEALAVVASNLCMQGAIRAWDGSAVLEESETAHIVIITIVVSAARRCRWGGLVVEQQVVGVGKVRWVLVGTSGKKVLEVTPESGVSRWIFSWRQALCGFGILGWRVLVCRQ
jgi:hypothetical protein